MVDYTSDMVEQMKACTFLQHARHLHPRRITVENAIEMATINSARALGIDGEVGSLEPGKRADIVVFDARKPHIGVWKRPLSTFVSAGRGADAKIVMVDGRICYRDGRFSYGPKATELLREAERAANTVLKLAGLTSRLSPLAEPRSRRRRTAHGAMIHDSQTCGHPRSSLLTSSRSCVPRSKTDLLNCWISTTLGFPMPSSNGDASSLTRSATRQPRCGHCRTVDACRHRNLLVYWLAGNSGSGHSYHAGRGRACTCSTSTMCRSLKNLVSTSTFIGARIPDYVVPSNSSAHIPRSHRVSA